MEAQPGKKSSIHNESTSENLSNHGLERSTGLDHSAEGSERGSDPERLPLGAGGSLSGRVNELGKQMEDLNSKVSTLNSNLDNLGIKVDALGHKIDHLGDHIGQKIAGLETEMKKNTATLTSIDDSIKLLLILMQQKASK